MRLRCWERTDPGLVRKSNEDAAVALSNFGIFAVCDGCGGRKGGQRASTIAAQKLAEEGVRLVQTFADYRSERDRELRSQILQQIARIFDEMSANVYQTAQANPELNGMATTSIMLTLIDNSGFIGHVGDSRLYLVRRNKIYQLTEDHSLFQKLVNAGKLSSKDYDRFPYKHVISRSIGSEPSVETDTLFVDLQPEDVFLICSDGVSDLVKPVEILNIAHYEGAEKLADRLIELSIERGAPDNATAVVIEVLQPGIGDIADDRDSCTIDFTARLTLLGDHLLFRPLNNQELTRMLRIVYEETFSDGDLILREGEPADCLYVVAGGRVQVSLNGVPLSFIDAGEHFGELALFEQAKRSATAHAVGEVTLLRIGKEEFFHLTQEDSALANKLLWVLLESAAGRIRELSGRLTGKV